MSFFFIGIVSLATIGYKECKTATIATIISAVVLCIGAMLIK
jgi:hypothetical protein